MGAAAPAAHHKSPAAALASIRISYY